MFGSSSATTTNNANTKISHVAAMKFSKLFRSEVVVRFAVDNAWQSGVWQNTDGDLRVLAEIPQVFLHFRRTCCAVDADDVWLHCLQRCVRSTNLGAHQHASSCFHGDLHLNGESATTCRHCATTCLHCCLDLQQVHARFNEEKISTTINKTASLLFV